jgi:hypothetical protein
LNVSVTMCIYLWDFVGLSLKKLYYWIIYIGWSVYGGTEASGDIEETFQDTMRLGLYIFKTQREYSVRKNKGFGEMFGIMPNFEGLLWVHNWVHLVDAMMQIEGVL